MLPVELKRRLSVGRGLDGCFWHISGFVTGFSSAEDAANILLFYSAIVSAVHGDIPC